MQLSLQTVSLPSTTFSKPFSTDPALAPPEDVKGKGRAVPPPRGTGAGAAEKAARINAAMLALVDAGVQCRGMLVAVAVAILPAPGASDDDDEQELRLDPSQEEEVESLSTHVFAFSFGQGVGGTEGTCVGVDSVGTFSEDQVRLGALLLCICFPVGAASLTSASLAVRRARPRAIRRADRPRLCPPERRDQVRRRGRTATGAGQAASRGRDGGGG